MALKNKFPIIDEITVTKMRLKEVQEISELYNTVETNAINKLVIEPSGEANPERAFKMTIGGNEPIFMPVDMKNGIIDTLKNGYLPSLESNLNLVLQSKIDELTA